jgi:hypothetical protein
MLVAQISTVLHYFNMKVRPPCYGSGDLSPGIPEDAEWHNWPCADIGAVVLQHGGLHTRVG